MFFVKTTLAAIGLTLSVVALATAPALEVVNSEETVFTLTEHSAWVEGPNVNLTCKFVFQKKDWSKEKGDMATRVYKCTEGKQLYMRAGATDGPAVLSIYGNNGKDLEYIESFPAAVVGKIHTDKQ